MALLDIKLRSQALGKNVSLYAIIPEERKSNNKLKVLWLLHGMRHDHSSWCRETGIERYVESKELCVIMPGVDLSYYTDMVYGGKYFTYVAEELPEKLRNILQISTNREDNYVAGVSMGGYGSIKIALNYPEKYAMAASISGVLDLELMYDIRSFDEDLMWNFGLIFGSREKFNSSINDLKYMATIRKEDINLPQLYMCCGKNDFLYNLNLGYFNYLMEQNITVTYEEDENYSHNWMYWDKKIQRVLDWMGI